jgi:hypothetical protein
MDVCTANEKPRHRGIYMHKKYYFMMAHLIVRLKNSNIFYSLEG